MHKQPIQSQQREAMSWLFLGMMVATEEHDWPPGLPEGYFGGLSGLARSIRAGDMAEVSAALRAKFSDLGQVRREVLDDPIRSVMACLDDDALLVKIEELSGRAEKRKDGAFSLESLAALHAALGEYLVRQAAK